MYLYGNPYLIGQIGARNFATLCVLAAHMDENRMCQIPQSTIGHLLGISAQAAGQRVRQLLECRVGGKPVVEVVQKPFSVTTYRIVTDLIQLGGDEWLFFRINIEAIKNFDAPFIAEVGDENVCTLLVLAAFMDKDGYCYPSQETIGKLLGVSTHSAGKRIRKLAQCTYRGQPLIIVGRQKTPANRFPHSIYHIVTSVVSIFT